MKVIGKRRAIPVENQHKYCVQLIRREPKKDERFKFVESVAMEKTTDTFKQAIDAARTMGARPWAKGDYAPKIEGALAFYPCTDKRFIRVQIKPKGN